MLGHKNSLLPRVVILMSVFNHSTSITSICASSLSCYSIGQDAGSDGKFKVLEVY